MAVSGLLFVVLSVVALFVMAGGVTPVEAADSRNLQAVLLAATPIESLPNFWYANIATFGPDTFDVTANVTYADPPRACTPLNNATGQQYRGRIVVAYRGDCTFLVKAQNVQDAGAAAFLFVSNTSDAITMQADGGSGLVIPSVSLGSDAAQQLNATLPSSTYYRLYIPRDPGFDGASAIILLIAIGAVVLGAYASSTVERAEHQHRYQPVAGPRRPPVAGATPPGEIAFLDERAACLFIAFASVGLVVMYFLIDRLIYVLIFIFAFAGAQSLLFNLSALATTVTALRPLTERIVNLRFIGPTPLVTLVLVPPCALLSIVWVWQRNSSWGWTLQDLLALNLLVMIQRTVRIPNLKVNALLLSLAFVYDVFFVFATPVMMHVATGGGTGEAVPMLIRLPRFDREGYSLLGLGDVALPGFLVSFLLRYDYSAGLDWRSGGYFAPAVAGYSAGLVLTDFALYAMNGHGQPALLYLVPCTLGLTILLAWRRGKLTDLWSGAGMPQDAAAAVAAQANADASAQALPQPQPAQRSAAGGAAGGVAGAAAPGAEHDSSPEPSAANRSTRNSSDGDVELGGAGGRNARDDNL